MHYDIVNKLDPFKDPEQVEINHFVERLKTHMYNPLDEIVTLGDSG